MERKPEARLEALKPEAERGVCAVESKAEPCVDALEKKPGPCADAFKDPVSARGEEKEHPLGA